MSEAPSKWPRPEDVLFKEGDANVSPLISGDAVVPATTFTVYADGYRDASLRLIDYYLNNTESLPPNQLVFPILFLARHYIEVRLKELIIACDYIKNGSDSEPWGHGLQDLWNAFEQSYATIGGFADKIALEQTARLVTEFASIDPNSIDFRYPDRERLPERLDLQNFRMVLVRIGSLIDAVSVQMYMWRDMVDSEPPIEVGPGF